VTPRENCQWRWRERPGPGQREEKYRGRKTNVTALATTTTTTTIAAAAAATATATTRRHREYYREIIVIIKYISFVFKYSSYGCADAVLFARVSVCRVCSAGVRCDNTKSVGVRRVSCLQPRHQCLRRPMSRRPCTSAARGDGTRRVRCWCRRRSLPVALVHDCRVIVS